MQTHIFNPGVAAYRFPHREDAVARVPGFAWRGKHERTLPAGLAPEDAVRLRVQWNRPGTGLAVDKDQRVGVDFRPA